MGNKKDRALETALLAWLGHVLGGDISLDVLDDGKLLWSTLQAIAPTYFKGGLPEPLPSDNWIRKWQNCKWC